MKVALIADVHGNRVGLEACLEAVEAEDPDRVVCLGDVAATGPEPRACVDRLRDLGCPVVMGNTDEDLLAPPEAGPKVPPPHPLMAEVNAWAADRLGEEDRAYLEGFEPTVEVPLPGEGGDHLCFHGSPRSNVDVLLPTTPPDQVEEMMGEASFAVGAGGHTHQPMVRRLGDRLLVNPGSVGLPFLAGTGPDPVAARKPPWAEWGLVSAGEDGDLSVDLRRTSYDLEAYRESVRSSGMPGADEWLEGWGPP